MKTFAAIAAALAIALGVSGANSAHAAADAGSEALPPTYIIHKLTQDGIQLRKLESDGRIYEARVEATDGSIVKVGIDPQTAELTDAYSHAGARKAEGAAPRVSAAEAIQTVAVTGHWDVREVAFDRIDPRWRQGGSDAC